MIYMTLVAGFLFLVMIPFIFSIANYKKSLYRG